MCNTVAASVFLVHVLVLVEVLETHIIGVPSPSIEVGCVAAQVWSLTQFYSVDFSQSRIGAWVAHVVNKVSRRYFEKISKVEIEKVWH